MEIVTSPFFASVKRYRRRRRYRRLGGHRRRGDARAGRNWRLSKIRVVPRLRPRVVLSPLKILRRLRDAYVRMMLNFAGHLVQLNNGNVFLAKKIPEAPTQTRLSI